ncbi:MAG: HlyD family efflux transporter periplasmic adaptor subunit [Burkholderiales bacterium]|nr:HlyD family efflux transporter periplasmic adaptor subunit [Burkholderiales bacterium]
MQKRRVELAQDTHSRYQELGKQNFMPALQVQQKADELLDQQGKLGAMLRSAGELRSQIGALAAEIDADPLKDANQKAEIQRNITALQQDLAVTEAQREVRITAPVAGTIVGIQVEPGQTANGTEPLAAIIPDGSRLVAYFYAPSSAIGFVKAGQSVMLRYQPFPYQKFGQHAGVVTDVSRSAVKAVPTNVANPSGESLYRITVRPAEQAILAYGKQEPLQPDMQVEADVLTDRRRLIEWIFEPLLSIKGRL